MARFRQILMVSLQLGTVYRRDGILSKNLFRGLCSRVESPELPDCFKSSNEERSQYLDLDDDFVVPTQMENSEHESSSSKAHGHGAKVKILTQEVTDPDVDEVSNILKANLMSPGVVVKALDNCSVKVSKDLVDKILKRFSNDWIPAFGFFLWTDAQIGYKHSPETCDMMVDILGKSKKFDLMWGLLEEMSQAGGLVSLVTMAKVMRRLAGAGRWNDAINTFHALERFGVKKDTASMNVLLDTLCKERSVRRARDAFLELKSDIQPNATSFNVLIHGWCKARKLEEARNTVVEMRESGFSPCVITYTSLIEAYCLDKNLQMVYAIFDEMHQQGCFPNIVTYTIVMHSLGKAKETQEALEIFERVKKEGCVPDTSFYNSLIYILCKAGRLQDANVIYEEMCKNGSTPNVTTYNTLISAFCHRSQEKNALSLLLEMEENSCKPDIKTYAPLLKLCCRRQWIRILLHLLGHMFRKDISPDFGTYILLINGLCRNGKLEQSSLFFKEMVFKGLTPRHYTYTTLLKALERENMDNAKEKIQQLMMRAQKLRETSDHSLHKQQEEEG
nr:pentatricopeptide repeat protein AaPPR1113 [Agave angustifolia]